MAHRHNRHHDNRARDGDDYGGRRRGNPRPTFIELEAEGLSHTYIMSMNSRYSKPVSRDIMRNKWDHFKTGWNDGNLSLHGIHASEYSVDKDGAEKIRLSCSVDGNFFATNSPVVETKWLHLQRKCLGLDVLKKLVMTCPIISQDLQKVAVMVLEEVKGQKKRKGAFGARGRYRSKPKSAIRGTARDIHDERLESQSVIFLSGSYLELCKKPSQGKSPTDSPTKSLLQSLYGFDVGKDHRSTDLVTKTGMGSASESLYVPELWCLLVGSDLIITFSEHSLVDICGDFVEIDSKAVSTNQLLTVHVKDWNLRPYWIVINTGYTYMEFLRDTTSILKDADPDTDSDSYASGTDPDAIYYDILDEDKITVTPQKWIKMIQSGHVEGRTFHIRKKPKSKHRHQGGFQGDFDSAYEFLREAKRPLKRSATYNEMPYASQKGLREEAREARRPLKRSATQNKATDWDTEIYGKQNEINTDISPIIITVEPKPTDSQLRIRAGADTSEEDSYLSETIGPVRYSEYGTYINDIIQLNQKRSRSLEESKGYLRSQLPKRPSQFKDKIVNDRRLDTWMPDILTSEDYAEENTETKAPRGTNGKSGKGYLEVPGTSRVVESNSGYESDEGSDDENDLSSSDGPRNIRIPTKLVSLDALRVLGYAYTVEGNTTIVQCDLEWETIGELLLLSGKCEPDAPTTGTTHQPFFTWRQSSAKDDKSGLNDHPDTIAIRVLSRVQKFVSEGRLIRLYDDSFSCTIEELLQRHNYPKRLALPGLKLHETWDITENLENKTPRPSSQVDDEIHKETLTKLVTTSQQVIGQFLPLEGSAKIHSVTKKLWGALDNILRQITWSLAIQKGSSIKWRIREPLSFMASLAKEYSNCKACSKGTLYSSPDEALRHLHIHSACSNPGKSRNPSNDTCFALLEPLDRSVRHSLMSLTIQKFIDALERIMGLTTELHWLVASVSSRDRKEIDSARSLPRNLVYAFQDLLYFFIITAEEISLSNRLEVTGAEEPSRPSVLFKLQKAQSRREQAFSNLVDFLEDSKLDIMVLGTTPRSFDVFSLENLGPEFLAAALVANMQKRPIVTGTDADVVDMYQDYVSTLRYEAIRHPRRRIFLEIYSLQEELEALAKVVESQESTLRDYERLLDPDSYRITEKIRESRFPVESEYISFHLGNKLAERSEEIDKLQDKARVLREQVKQAIEVLEEGHGKAIRVFTIVTLFFLPLSFTTSFFGMNTTDIRDISYDQSIFWTTGLPVTVGVCALAFIYAYKGEQVQDFINMALSPKKKLSRTQPEVDELSRRNETWLLTRPTFVEAEMGNPNRTYSRSLSYISERIKSIRGDQNMEGSRV